MKYEIILYWSEADEGPSAIRINRQKSKHSADRGGVLAYKRKTSNHSRLLVFLLWQGMRDSNPRKRSQSPVCYRYTNPLNGLLPKRMIIITISRKKSRLIFSFLQKLKPGGTGL